MISYELQSVLVGDDYDQLKSLLPKSKEDFYYINFKNVFPDIIQLNFISTVDNNFVNLKIKSN